MHIIKKNYLIKIAFTCLLFFLGSNLAFASSSLYITGPKQAPPSSEFAVSLMLDTSERVNAVDIEISYPKDKLKFLSSNNAGSIIDFWQSTPRVVEAGKISLSGGVMQGFTGDRGLLVKIYFKVLPVAQVPNNAEITFTKKNLYLADGKGTSIIPVSTGIKVEIRDGATLLLPPEDVAFEEEIAKDITPPEITLTLVKNPRENNSLIVFNVIDKESGVKATDIRYKKWFAFSEWVPAQNPVVYSKGAWVIELRAENNADLISTQVLKMPARLGLKLIGIVSLAFLTVIAISLYNKHRRKGKL